MFFLFLNAAALAAGQLLFKSTAIRVRGLPFAAMVSKIAFVPSFYAACLLYAAATVLWVWILTRLPLSTAYPFVGLSFVMVALAGWCFLGEPPSIRGVGILRRAAGGRRQSQAADASSHPVQVRPRSYLKGRPPLASRLPLRRTALSRPPRRCDGWDCRLVLVLEQDFIRLPAP